MPDASGRRDSLNSQTLGMFRRAAACRRCPRMEGRRRVVGPLNGDTGAAIMFVGEAPGRLGAERHGIPFHGDAAGRNFELLLAQAGFARGEVFITNAVLCNPQTPQGLNSRPSASELAECRPWLRETIELVDPRLVVALGATALRSLAFLEPHGLVLRRDAGRSIAWFGRSLAALYHPGGRSLARRPLAVQIRDWLQIAAWAASSDPNLYGERQRGRLPMKPATVSRADAIASADAVRNKGR